MTFLSELSRIFHSDHPFMIISQDIIKGLSYIWHYVLIRADGQPITIGNVVIGLLLFSIGLRYAKKVSSFIPKKIFAKANLDEHSATSLERFSYYMCILLITLFVFEVSNVPFTTLTVLGTTFAVGIGLGSQNIVNNFISGLIIMIEKPIKLGDMIEVKNVIGRVTHIGSRCVSLRTEDNINMLIPNSYILQDSIINWTLNDPIIKMTLPLFVQKNYSITELDILLEKILSENKYTLKMPPPKILLQEICEECLALELEFWISLEQEIFRKDIINSINREIETIFKENNINISDGPDNKEKRQINYLYAKLHK